MTATDDSISKTVNYKIAICGLEKVTVAETEDIKITKYYNEYKKDYDNELFYAESIYSDWF